MMHANEIEPGDQFWETGRGYASYEVLAVNVTNTEVTAIVKFHDGGLGNRLWDLDQWVPLTRPEVKS